MITVCPRCDKALFVLEFRGIEVDLCHHCRGLWLDAWEFELLLARTGDDPHTSPLKFEPQKSKPSKGEKMLCPRCDRRLEEIPVRGQGDETVMLDRCPQGHGVWFDDHELQELLEILPPESHAKKTVEYLDDLLGSRRCFQITADKLSETTRKLREKPPSKGNLK